MILRPSTWSTPSGLNKIQGKPFTVAEVVEKIEELLAD